MGFWSSIGSAISSVGSAICSGISSCAKAIGLVGGSVGNAVSVGMKAISAICPAVRTVTTVVSIIGTAIDIVGKIAGIVKPEEKIEDLGDKAIQAEKNGVTLESCKNDFDKYMESIRAQPLDPDLSKTISLDEKMLAGSLLIDKGLEIKFPNLQTFSLWPILALAPENLLTKSKLTAWIECAKKIGVPLASVAKFLLGDEILKGLNDVKADIKNLDEKQGGDVLMQAEKTLTPNKSDFDILKDINSLKDAIARNAESLENQ